MKVVNQSHKIIYIPDNPLQLIESVARTCYKSEDKIKPGSDEKMVRMLVDKGHHAMIEFGDIIVKFITNRGVTHEMVRHRLCSFAQESTRYVRYDGNMEFIKPVWWYEWSIAERREWEEAMVVAEAKYLSLLKMGSRAEQAREVLPNSLKTEINKKGNFREWRHIFNMRCQKAAHPQIRDLMIPVLREVSEKIPVIFDDLAEKFLKDGE